MEIELSKNTSLNKPKLRYLPLHDSDVFPLGEYRIKTAKT